LVQAVRRAGTPAVVGIDPRFEALPPEFRVEVEGTNAISVAASIERFCRELLPLVAERVAVVKFQSAYFEELGPAGVEVLHRLCRDAQLHGLLVILDAKRNDIGPTAAAYARGYLGRPQRDRECSPTWDIDALTINPYLGSDGIQPFVDEARAEGRGLFVLVRTSNPSAREIQDLRVEGRAVYEHVADRLLEWADPLRGDSGYSAVGAVVGATYPDELRLLRKRLPGVLFLVPGYGAQGGTVADVVGAFDASGIGGLINSSRGITEAHLRPRYRERFGEDWKSAMIAAIDEMVGDLGRALPRMSE
jgi:orotidine-5'-phosphate decarboxylase